MIRLSLLAVLSVTVLGGCAFERHTLNNPERNQVIKVASGDDWIFRLNEPDGSNWEYDCADPDVRIEIKHIYEELNAKVHLHIHRGYDGPSTVRFSLRNRTNQNEIKSFNLGLFKRTGDEAFWK